MVAFCYFNQIEDESEAVDGSTAVELMPKDIVRFESFGENNFTCTGLTYDETEDAFWIADFGAVEPEDQRKPRLVQVDRAFSRVMNELVVECLEDGGNLQGLAFDTSADSLWIASESVLVNLDKNGKEIRRIETGEICDSSANGLAYDSQSDTLWVLFYRHRLVNITKDGSVISEFEIDLEDQDHLTLTENVSLLASVGADYAGDGNYVVEIDTEDGSLEALYRMERSYAVEGIVALDGNLYVANDGLYHDAVIKESYIAVYGLAE